MGAHNGSVKINLDGYFLGDVIAKGQYASIYSAEQANLNRPVVLKILNPRYSNDLEVLGDFRDEINIGTMLNHPNIVKIHNAGEGGRYMYYSMDLLHEGVLAEQAERNLFSSVDTCLEYFRGMTEGMGYALQQGFYHGNLSMGNIFLNPGGEAKLFGFRYAVEDGDLLDTDIKALGSIFYEMLSGEKWQPDSDADPLHKLRPDVTPFMSGLVTELLTRGASGRIRSYDKLLKDLHRARIGRAGSSLMYRKQKKRIRRL